ncbi:MAG TPA: hypothetical protein PLC47_08520, partial [Bacteroidales bacterium]|nr:hypothetical protein [Bacteroidales bacterium]
MKAFSRYVILLVVLFLSGSGNYLLYAQQNVKELETDKKRIEQEIAYTNKLLEETTQSKEMTFEQLLVLRSRISKRANLLATIQKQLLQVESQISRSTREIERLEKERKALRREYARMIEIAYQNRGSYNKLIFLFSANDFNQAFQRLKYLQQYAAFRRNQIEKIEEANEKIKAELLLLDQEQKKQKALLDEERREQTVLQTEQQNVDQSVKT